MSEDGQVASTRGSPAASLFEVGVGFYAIIFTDIVLSTGLRTQLGDELADVYHAEVDALTREIIEMHRGRVVKGLGDGLMAILVPPTLPGHWP